jgi:hypothetical protein
MYNLEKRSDNPTQNPSEPKKKDKARIEKEKKESDNPIKKDKK